MSFNRYKDTIEYGDTVIVFLSVSKMYTLVVNEGEVFQTMFGAIKHDDLIGQAYGSLVSTCRGTKKGFVHVLYPTPELWTITLPHRTQILYSTDISVIILQLDLKPGKVVCESGTGSGSLSHALLRSLAPNGHLHTFDFHEERVRLCQKEFEVHGIGHLVTARQRDVVRDGFGLTHVADAVFLDLPLPWDVVPSAKRALKRTGGRICSFSPCIEQVQNTCEVLAANGFRDIKTLECLQRPLEVRARVMPSLPTSAPTKEPTANRAKTLPATESMDCTVVDAGATERSTPEKRERPARRGGGGGGASWAGAVYLEDANPRAPGAAFVEALPAVSQVGHTGFLTFATLPPFQNDVKSVAPPSVGSAEKELVATTNDVDIAT